MFGESTYQYPFDENDLESMMTPTEPTYEQHLAAFKQIQNFAGVGAHHHNGMAECAIQTIMSIARTMMLHTAIHWPEVANTSL